MCKPYVANHIRLKRMSCLSFPKLQTNRRNKPFQFLFFPFFSSFFFHLETFYAQTYTSAVRYIVIHIYTDMKNRNFHRRIIWFRIRNGTITRERRRKRINIHFMPFVILRILMIVLKLLLLFTSWFL